MVSCNFSDSVENPLIAILYTVLTVLTIYYNISMLHVDYPDKTLFLKVTMGSTQWFPTWLLKSSHRILIGLLRSSWNELKFYPCTDELVA